jgi:dephospho-CoA kinase
MILGLTGSFGSGKSTVADMLQSSGGAHVIDTDQIVHELQKPGKPGFAGIVATFGPDVVSADGELDRRTLSAIVFTDDEKLKTLNGIMHPMVWDKVARIMDRLKDHPLIVLVVPLLFETGAEKLCDKVVVVSVSEEERSCRLMKRSGLTATEVNGRLAAQMPQKEKEDRADVVINNSGSLAETEMQVNNLLQQWGLPAAQPR